MKYLYLISTIIVFIAFIICLFDDSRITETLGWFSASGAWSILTKNEFKKNEE